MKRKRKGKIMSFNNVKFDVGHGPTKCTLSISQDDKGNAEFALIDWTGDYAQATEWALGVVPHDYRGHVVKDGVHPLLSDVDGLATLIELATRWRKERLRFYESLG